jgi:hypothetical protein
MNRDALPMNFAPFQLICTGEDRREDIAGNFVTQALAHGTRDFLAGLFPKNSYRVTEETPVFPALKGAL